MGKDVLKNSERTEAFNFRGAKGEGMVLIELFNLPSCSKYDCPYSDCR